MAAGNVVATVTKPVMRGLLNSQIKHNLIMALSISTVCGFAFKFIVGSDRKKRYAEFYRTYDAEKEFEEMRQKGLFQSC